MKFKIAPDWHIYWINPGDTGLPTKGTFDLPPGFTASDLQFPVPRRIELPGNLVSFGYEDEVMLLATVTPPRDLDVGSDVTIRGKASWLVCKENCLRGDQNVQMTLKTDAKPQAANQAEFDKWRALLPRENGDVKQDVQVDAPGGQFKSASGKLVLECPDAVQKAEWFPASQEAFNVTASDVKTEGNRITVTFKVEPIAGEKVSDMSLFSVIGYTVKGQRVGVVVPIRFSNSPKVP